MAHQLNVRLPESLREQAKTAAKEQGVSVNQFCALAIARAVGEAQGAPFLREATRRPQWKRADASSARS